MPPSSQFFALAPSFTWRALWKSLLCRLLSISLIKLIHVFDNSWYFLARFYTYGDLPLEGHLEHIENKVLHHFDKISVATDIPPEHRWTEPVSSCVAVTVVK